MTVTKIVEDLLKYKLITCEAALVLLKAEAEANAFKGIISKTTEKNKVEKNISTSNLYSIEDYYNWYTTFTN